MAAQGPPRPPPNGPAPGAQQGPFLGGRQLSPAEVQQRMEEEAKKHGLTLQQFMQIQRAQQQRLEQEAAKVGMTPQAFLQMQQQKIADEAAKLGITPQQFIAQKQQEAIKMQQQAQQQAAAQGGAVPGQPGQPGQPGLPPQPGQMQPPPGAPPGAQMQRIDLNKPVEPKPEALAMAKFLRAQDLKCRTCIFDGQRKDMFKVKRLYRALESDAYKKARTKDPLLPEIKTDLDKRNALQLLPLNMLALRVSKKDHTGHNHGPKKRVKGLWDVKIEGQQDFDPMMHYMWIYEQPSIKTKVYSVLALIAVFTVVLFPLWPIKMRQGVWYLSVGGMFLLGGFFAMAIFRLILFGITYFAVPPGLWLFPNLFEDVGFIDSFIPLWGWQETKKGKKKSSSKGASTGAGAAALTSKLPGQSMATANMNGGAEPAAVSTGAETNSTLDLNGALPVTKRHAAPTVEEADDDE